MFDLAEVEWTSLDEVSPDDQEKLLQAKDTLTDFLNDTSRNLISKHKYCLDNNFVPDLVSPSQLTLHYTSVPVEFRLREFYRSQLAFLDWVLENTPESREKDNLLELIGSIERKYLLAAEQLEKPERATRVPPGEIEASLELTRTEKKDIQTGLWALGFNPGVPDGVFGARTRKAIREWQSSRGAPPTGHLDDESKMHLLDAVPDLSGSIWLTAQNTP